MSGAFGVGVAGGTTRRLADGAQPGPLDVLFAVLFVLNTIVLLKI